jgi:predicted DNA-binding transcriptional regulator AlpA
MSQRGSAIHNLADFSASSGLLDGRKASAPDGRPAAPADGRALASSPRPVIRGESPPSNGRLFKQSFSVKEFCQLHAISRSFFYLLRERGSAPRIMKVGKRTLISADAAAEWRKDMEQAAR